MESTECTCPLIDRVKALEEHKERTEDFKNRVGAKLDRIEIHHQELLQQQTKQSGSIVILTNTVEMQKVDREEKHKELKDLVHTVLDTFNKHTEEEMMRYAEIKNVQDDNKWKTKIMWGVMTAAGTGLLGLGFWLIREFIQKGL